MQNGKTTGLLVILLSFVMHANNMQCAQKALLKKVRYHFVYKRC